MDCTWVNEAFDLTKKRRRKNLINHANGFIWSDTISLCPELNPLVIVQQQTRTQHDGQQKDIFELGGWWWVRQIHGGV